MCVPRGTELEAVPMCNSPIVWGPAAPICSGLCNAHVPREGPHVFGSYSPLAMRPGLYTAHVLRAM